MSGAENQQTLVSAEDRNERKSHLLAHLRFSYFITPAISSHLLPIYLGDLAGSYFTPRRIRHWRGNGKVATEKISKSIRIFYHTDHAPTGKDIGTTATQSSQRIWFLLASVIRLAFICLFRKHPSKTEININEDNLF